MSYGFRYHIKWDPKVHEEQDKMYSELEEEYRADNQMNWFLKQVCCSSAATYTL